MHIRQRLSRDQGAVLAGLMAPLALAAVLVPFRTSFPNTDAALALLLVIGVAVTEIAVWGRRQHAAASRRAGYLDGINDTARSMAAGNAPAGLVEQVSAQLTQLLSLRAAGFQYGVAGLGKPARLLHDGRVMVGAQSWDPDRDGLPGGDLELLVENGGLLQGRFLMTPLPGARPTLEQRLVAISLAEQAGAALAAGQPVTR